MIRQNQQVLRADGLLALWMKHLHGMHKTNADMLNSEAYAVRTAKSRSRRNGIKRREKCRMRFFSAGCCFFHELQIAVIGISMTVDYCGFWDDTNMTREKMQHKKRRIRREKHADTPF
ncbi:MAG: hypothetical protein IKI45_15150 [Oscillospiraceae bacterium]|nr:hypothetical protein [Oscillospiraceae bacterium]